MPEAPRISIACPSVLEKYLEPAYVLGDGKGFAQLVGLYGDQRAIVNAARVSYAKGTKKTREDAALIHYLLEHHHDTPFEMPVATFIFKMPIFTARQHDRHRASSKNEESGRYSEVGDDYYVPTTKRIQGQSKTNKQGSDGVTLENAEDAQRWISSSCEAGLDDYKRLLDMGVTRELARGVLSQNTYTSFVWQTNLRMLLHYLGLRDDSHAQWEIRQYAKFADAVVKAWVPDVHAAYEEFRKNALVVPASAIDRLGVVSKAKPESLSERTWNALLARLEG